MKKPLHQMFGYLLAFLITEPALGATGDDLNNFIASKGGGEACLLSGRSANNVAWFIEKNSGSALTLLKRTTSSACTIGSIAYNCIDISVTNSALARLKNHCRNARCSPSNLANSRCPGWNNETALEQQLLAHFNPTKHTSGKSGNEVAMLIESGTAARPELSPLTLVTKNGQKAEIRLSTPNMRNNNPDKILELANTLGVSFNNIRWIGSKDSLITNDAGKLHFHRKRSTASPIKVEIINHHDFKTRIINDFNHDIKIEDTTVNYEEVRELLLLMLLDSQFNIDKLKQMQYTFSPAIYLYK